MLLQCSRPQFTAILLTLQCYFSRVYNSLGQLYLPCNTTVVECTTVQGNCTYTVVLLQYSVLQFRATLLTLQCSCSTVCYSLGKFYLHSCSRVQYSLGQLYLHFSANVVQGTTAQIKCTYTVELLQYSVLQFREMVLTLQCYCRTVNFCLGQLNLHCNATIVLQYFGFGKLYLHCSANVVQCSTVQGNCTYTVLILQYSVLQFRLIVLTWQSYCTPVFYS